MSQIVYIKTTVPEFLTVIGIVKGFCYMVYGEREGKIPKVEYCSFNCISLY